MANPQLENGHTRIANEIWDEVIRRNFSKRQKDIIQFIWRLSYGCQKRIAIIPKLKDFSICGITPNHVKEELTYLVQSKVIFWNRMTNEFEFNKDYDLWQINPVKGWEELRFRELIRLNIAEKGTSQKRNFSHLEDEDKSSHFGKLDDDESDDTSQSGKSNFPKKEVDTSQKRNFDFPKKEVSDDSNACGSKDEDVPKESKEILKESKDIKAVVITALKDDPPSLSEDQLIGKINQVEAHFLSRKGKGIMISPTDFGVINQILKEGITLDVITQGIDKAFSDFKERNRPGEITSFSYCAPVIRELWGTIKQHQAREEQLEDQLHEDTIDPNYDPDADEELQALLRQMKTYGGEQIHE